VPCPGKISIFLPYFKLKPVIPTFWPLSNSFILKQVLTVFKINKKIEYALMALKYMHEHPEQVTVKELCHSFQVPFDTMAKVLQILSTHEVVRSSQGVKGGYQLQKNLSDLTLVKLSSWIEGPQHESFCQKNSGEWCELMHSCNIASPIERLTRQLYHMLDSLSLQDILYNDSVFILKSSIRNEGLSL
jgi:Rrf2 family protein